MGRQTWLWSILRHSPAVALRPDMRTKVYCQSAKRHARQCRAVNGNYSKLLNLDPALRQWHYWGSCGVEVVVWCLDTCWIDIGSGSTGMTTTVLFSRRQNSVKAHNVGQFHLHISRDATVRA